MGRFFHFFIRKASLFFELLPAEVKPSEEPIIIIHNANYTKDVFMLQDIWIRQRDFLLELAQILTQQLDLDTLLWQILRISSDLLGGLAGFIALYSDSEKWQVRITRGIGEAGLKYIETYLSKFKNESIETTESALLDINLLIDRIQEIQELGFTDGVGLPMVEHGKILGCIVIFRNYHTSFSLNDRMMLKVFADQASIAVHNAYLYTENIREKNRLYALINAAADGIMVLDHGHRIEQVNPALLKLLRSTADSIIGFHHDDVIVFSKISSGMELQDGEAGGWPFNRDSKLYVEGDLVYGQLSEKPLPVSITYTPVMNADNVMVNIIAMVKDISKFREADDLKNTFISTISHELKTPVSLIKGYASTMRLKDAFWDGKVLEESLSVIEEEADRLTGLINNLLDASRLYSGALVLNRSDVNLEQISIHVARRMQSQSDKHQIICSFPSDFPIIFGDADRIEQVILNLVSNAMKYAPDGEIQISGRRAGDFVEISIRDEGPGISSDDFPHLFERFFRSKKTADKAKGVGLGLYLCNAIVEGHGGKMWVENRTDREGAIFSFSLPLDPDDHPASLKFRNIGE
jgi:signal transduction histidine kinase